MDLVDTVGSHKKAYLYLNCYNLNVGTNWLLPIVQGLLGTSNVSTCAFASALALR